MKKVWEYFRSNVFRGVLAVIPLALSYFAIVFIYKVIDQRVIDLVDVKYRIPGMGIIVLLLVLYVIGFTASNIIGKRIFDLMESISNRIPIVNTTYQIGRQVAATLSLPEKQVFKRAVLIDSFKPGVRTIGFVTGTVVDKKSKETLLKVFIPTVPNPTTGFVFVVRESDVFDPNWTVEEAIRTVVSGGIIGPDTIS